MQEDYRVGLTYFEKKEFGEAHNYFRKALSSNEIFDVEFYIMAGKTARNLDLHIESRKIFESGINLYPDSADLYSELGVAFFHLNNKKESLNLLTKAIELQPNNPYRYSSRAYIKGSMGDMDGAIRDYEVTVKLDPKDEIAYNNLGLLYEKQGFQKKAQSNFDKSDEILENKGQGPRIKDFAKDVNVDLIDQNKEVKKEKVTTRSYFSTIKSVITNKKERKEFGKFIRRGLKGRR